MGRSTTADLTDLVQVVYVAGHQLQQGLSVMGRSTTADLTDLVQVVYVAGHQQGAVCDGSVHLRHQIDGVDVGQQGFLAAGHGGGRQERAGADVGAGGGGGGGGAQCVKRYLPDRRRRSELSQSRQRGQRGSTRGQRESNRDLQHKPPHSTPLCRLCGRLDDLISEPTRAVGATVTAGIVTLIGLPRRAR